ncbi:tol-pal system protein YbgF [Legionella sp. km772]|uniref:tol-pal system protein YbgF n=1 Tax=Legionella sp. km772 TaxID=2498111 RepID=UPI000F8DEB17|nr:tol-pal system protein YbgF [Legionella sp. km772]RUR10566.1 tol-pal system protein YbgF [Legionella sp. km772]
MINCKKHFIAACFSLMVPALGFAEAPVVDDSDNFAIIDEQPGAVRPNYEQPQIENAELDGPHAEKYQMDMAQDDDGPALAKDDSYDQNGQVQSAVKNGAALIERVQTLQKEVQELRGQLEVQAYELKKLQEQQLTFYKDLDSRINGAAKSTAKVPTNLGSSNSVAVVTTPTPTKPSVTPKNAAVVTAPVVAPASRANPADEQISYLAAYELVKTKQYDNAIKAMQTFVQKYPQGGYSANAEYWLGELFMVKKEYTKAIEHFDIVLQKFPSSTKAAASMLKSGYAYAASGNNQQAKQRLQQVVKNYPGTPTAQLANLKLEAINAI